MQIVTLMLSGHNLEVAGRCVRCTGPIRQRIVTLDAVGIALAAPMLHARTVEMNVGLVCESCLKSITMQLELAL